MSLKDHPYHCETLWALVRVDPATNKTSICYRMSNTRKDLWQGVIEDQIFGTGYTMARLQSDGWRATRVRVEEFK